MRIETLVDLHVSVFHHAWSQDIYLNGLSPDVKEGVCGALSALWLAMRGFATRAQQPPRQTFLDYIYTESAKRKVQGIQSKSNLAPIELGVRDALAGRLLPFAGYVQGEGMKLAGATVTDARSVATDMVVNNIGYFLMGFYGSGGGHMMAAAHFLHEEKVILFDPNYGEFSFTSFQGRLNPNLSFRSFLSALLSGMYEGELSRCFVVLHFQY
jgi:hypothetical protein